MRNNMPDLPEAVTALAADVQAELLDYEHINRVHGRRTTYRAGCRGPLCLKADREFNRERYAQSRAEAGKKYEPSDLRRDDRDDELDHACAVAEEHARIIEIVCKLTDLYAQVS